MLPALVLMALAAAVGCGSQEQKGQRAPTARVPRVSAIVGPGELVAIGGGRSLYLNCVGSGSPTVVLEAGFGGDAYNWLAVQPQLGRITRTCAYDRAGLGNSLPLPGVHDAREEISDLQRLLGHAHIYPPYVLVGHSYGGLLVRLFAQAHEKEVGGIVLVDAMGRDQTRRMLAIWPASEAQALRRSMNSAVRDGVDLAAGEALASRVRTLGHTPLAVITAGKHDAEWGHHVPARLAHAFDQLWTTMQDELAALSTDHLHVIALRSDHFVQSSDGQPLVVILAVRAVVLAAREHQRLPPCGRLFSGPDIRCRS